MRYLTRVLLPKEHVHFIGKVHPIVFAKGISYVAAASLVLYGFTNLSHVGGPLTGLGKWLSTHWQSPAWYSGSWDIHRFAMEYETIFRYLAGFLLLIGCLKLLRAFIIAHFTELAVTDQRIVYKTGVWDVTTIEVDRDRISGVIVHQSYLGRLLNYGWVVIQGFSHDIGGLPAISDPVKLQQVLARRSY
jgi:hypothetical protein